MGKKVVVIGTFDTKGVVYNFLIGLLQQKGMEVITVNTGVLEHEALFPVQVPAEKVAAAGGTTLAELRSDQDRGKAVAAMSAGARQIIDELFGREPFDAIIGMGGTAGTNIVTSAMLGLPYGLPKICLSTVASGNVAPYVGISDIMMLPSLTDISGINSLSELYIGHAAGALAGMLATTRHATKDKPVIGASMFGNTTACVNNCREQLSAKGFEVLVFHATGTGGRVMEKLTQDGLIQGVLDITTTEWADTICGGVFDAGPERLDAPGKKNLPHLITPGCIDMCNFGAPASVPGQYKDRLFYQWNPNVTLMRTTREENKRMGEIFADKANAAKRTTAFIIPLQGFSILDSVNDRGEAQPFWDPAADKAFIEGLKSKLDPSVEVAEVDANINDPLFADRAVELFSVLYRRITQE